MASNVEDERELPDSVKIGGRNYTILWDHESWEKVSDEKPNMLGHSNSHRLNIYINPNQHPDQKADTLLHEIMHSVISMNSGDLSNYSHLEELEEHIVSAVSPWLLLVLRENPDVIDYILEPF